MNLQPHKLVFILGSLLFALSSVTFAQQANETVAPTAAEQVNVSQIRLTVTDKYGRYVTGLSKEQITILDEKIPQEIVGLEQQDQPFSMLLLFDVSWSMPADGLSAARDEFLRFVEKANKSSDYAIVGFGKQTAILTEFTQDKVSLVAGLNKLANLKRRGGTAFNDAFSLALEKAQMAKQKKRIILIISDGVDNESNARVKELREQIKKTDVLVYAIAFRGTERFGRSLPWEELDSTSSLSNLCSITGGRVFYPRTPAELETLFDDLALELKLQYSVTFRPASLGKEGDWRRLKFKATPLTTKGWEKETLYVRGREGYFLMRP